MRTITALFVGLGSIGTRHLKNLHNLCTDRGWTLQADALRSDLHRPLRDGVAELLHAQYTDLAAAPARYDMVFITNPTSLHVEALQQVKGRGEGTFHRKADLFCRADRPEPGRLPAAKTRKPTWPRPCAGAV